MHTPDKNTLIVRAERLIRDHFEHLNNGELADARQQLFSPPGMSAKPVDVYLHTMREMAPFTVISLELREFEDVRKKRHGPVATTWITVAVNCSLGQRAADFFVWWFPTTDQSLIASRPTAWVLEKLKTNGTREP